MSVTVKYSHSFVVYASVFVGVFLMRWKTLNVDMNKLLEFQQVSDQ